MTLYIQNQTAQSSALTRTSMVENQVLEPNVLLTDMTIELPVQLINSARGSIKRYQVLRKTAART